MARPVTPVEVHHKHNSKKKTKKEAPPPQEPNPSQSSPPPKNKLLQNCHMADAEKGSNYLIYVGRSLLCARV